MWTHPRSPILLVLALVLAGCAESGDQQSREGSVGDGGAGAPPASTTPAGGSDPATTTTPGTTTTPSSPAGGGGKAVAVEIDGELTTGTYESYSGARFYVIGLLKNTGTKEASASVSASFKDASGKVVGSTSDYSPALLPGQSWPFMLETDGDTDGAEVSNYTVTVDPTEAFLFRAPAEGALTVSGDSMQQNSLDWWEVLGEVTNSGDREVSLVQIAVVFYDAEGKPVDVANGFTEPSDIPPGGTASFEVSNLRDDIEPDRYEIFVTGMAES